MRLLALAGALLLFVAGASAASATVVTLNGQVHDQNGNLVTGTHDVVVRIYSNSTSSTVLWSETHTSVTFTNGTFSIQVGSLTSGGVPATYLTGYNVGVSVSSIGLPELDPRIQTVDDKSTWTGFW